MARYVQAYAGERRTDSLGIKLTPSERAELEAAAAAHGVRLSDYVRGLCLDRKPATSINGVSRNPDARALMRELSAIGSNLNQLTKIANTIGAIPQLNELRTTTDKIKAALARVLAL